MTQADLMTKSPEENMAHCAFLTELLRWTIISLGFASENMSHSVIIPGPPRAVIFPFSYDRRKYWHTRHLLTMNKNQVHLFCLVLCGMGSAVGAYWFTLRPIWDKRWTYHYNVSVRHCIIHTDSTVILRLNKHRTRQHWQSNPRVYHSSPHCGTVLTGTTVLW